jgi:acyl-CoA reductase-like NAD-dependent aldehyde dehydrogenase
VAAPLVEDPRPRMVTFTGSAAVGWSLKPRADRKRVALELGGTAPNLVHEDADVALAARRCAFGAFAYAGQVCISVQRVLVHAPVYDSFCGQLVAAAQAIPCGDPADPAVICGPMISREEADRVQEWVADACRRGGRLLLAGERRGSVLGPTIVEDPPAGCDLAVKEIFGPVLTLQRYDRFAEALRLANDTPYGLQAGVFTRNVDNAFAAFRELEYGGVILNDCSIVRVDSYPYGGVKESGIGREGVRYAIEEMTERRILVLNLRL